MILYNRRDPEQEQTANSCYWYYQRDMTSSAEANKLVMICGPVFFKYFAK